MALSVYVAASSAEISRALAVTSVLRQRGVTVVSTWPEVIMQVGEANPRGATVAQRRAWSGGCLQEVAACDVLLLLAPVDDHGRGAYWEAGAAHAQRKGLVVSGDSLQSVFGAQAVEFRTDAEAIAHVVELAHGAQPLDLRLKNALTGGSDAR